MRYGLGFGLSIMRGGSIPLPIHATNVTSIGADGWRATYPTPPAEFDPVVSPETVSVVRQGFNAAGASATVTDIVTLMKRVRLPYPDENTLTADQVSLSDFVYATDTITDVTNNSTRAAPLPIAAWGVADREIARGSTYRVNLAVAHAHARDGKPVAAVLFSATDGTNTLTQLVTATVYETFSASGLGTSFYQWDIPLAGFDASTEITVDAEIRPWVGAAFTISTDADAYPSPNLCVLKFLNDSGDTYGHGHVFVDATLGNNATGIASATKASAEALPFLTLAAAATALRAFNSTTYSRSDAGGGTAWLVEGTHDVTKFTGAESGDWPLTVRSTAPEKRLTTIIQNPAVTSQGTIPKRLKFLDLTFKKMGASVTFLDSYADLTNYTARSLTFDNVYFDSNGNSEYKGWLYRTGIMSVINTSGNWTPFENMANVSKMGRAVGCNFAGKYRTTDNFYSALACLDACANDISAVGNLIETVGQLTQDCFMNQKDPASSVRAYGKLVGPRGAAFVGNVFEASGGNTPSAVHLWADNNVKSVQNIVFMGNTVVGSRLNYLYQDTGTVQVDKSGYFRNNVSENRNTKSDVFPTASGNRVGNWPATHNVGSRNNTIPLGSNNEASHTPSSWLGAVAALGDTNAGGTLAGLDWTDNRSFSGTKAGGGDYTPGASNQIATIAAKYVHAAYDQNGTALAIDGSAVGGALQP